MTLGRDGLIGQLDQVDASFYSLGLVVISTRYGCQCDRVNACSLWMGSDMTDRGDSVPQGTCRERMPDAKMLSAEPDLYTGFRRNRQQTTWFWFASHNTRRHAP